ncbi:MAG: hypothetical protein IT462_11270 [Planctomycetes bacterium]|nr:hypothetical protein [Planctomycetota bacterium]
MRTYLLWAALFALVCGVLATNTVTVSAQAAAKEFKDGWNTWEEAKKGDWVEYKFSAGFVKRFEVSAASGGQLTVKSTLYPADGGKPVVQEGKPQEWKKVSMISGKVPTDADWTAAKQKRSVGTDEVECDIVSWTVGSTSNTVYYSKSVPCGGVVCVVTSGQERIWLTKWGSSGKEAGLRKVDLPKFYKKVGHKALYSEVKKAATRDAEPATYRVMEITKVDDKEDRVVYTEAPCDKKGEGVVASKVVTVTKDSHDLTKPYSKPELDNGKPKIEKIVVGAVTYSCKLVKSEERKATESSEYLVKTSTWITDFGLIVRQVIDNGSETTTIELIGENSGLQK